MTQKQQEAYDMGYEAGYNDEGTKCPYLEGSEEELYWLSGHNAGLDGYSRSFDM
jgi:ribosome modulation factor